MKILVKVQPWSKTERVEQLLGNSYKVYVSEPAKEGKSNQRLVELLAEYFNVGKNKVEIKSGHTARIKIIEIAD